MNNSHVNKHRPYPSRGLVAANHGAPSNKRVVEAVQLYQQRPKKKTSIQSSQGIRQGIVQNPHSRVWKYQLRYYLGLSHSRNRSCSNSNHTPLSISCIASIRNHVYGLTHFSRQDRLRRSPGMSAQSQSLDVPDHSNISRPPGTLNRTLTPD